MKKLSLLLVTLLVASISMVNADESSTTDAGVPTTSSSTMTEEVRPEPTLYNKEMMEKKRMEMKANKEKFKTQLEAKKEEMKSMTDANREEMKSNNQDFKTERASMQKPMLTEEQKTELKSVVEAFRTQMDEHKKMIEAGTMTKEELMVKVEELKTTTYEKVKAIIGDNEMAQKLLGMKKETVEKNMDLKKENKETRKDFKEDATEIKKDFKQSRQDLRVKYRTQFTTALGNRLDNMEQAKLKMVLTRIDEAKTKVEANTKLSQENKDKLLAQLDALKDIINEKLGNTDSESSLDIDSLLQ